MTTEHKPHSELLARAAREPLGVDISDYSDEWCAGFLAGQENGVRSLIEQFETLQHNAIRRFQVIFNERDIEVMRRLAYDGIAEVTGNEWRDVTSSNPASVSEQEEPPFGEGVARSGVEPGAAIATTPSGPCSETPAQSPASVRCGDLGYGGNVGPITCQLPQGHPGEHAAWARPGDESSDKRTWESTPAKRDEQFEHDYRMGTTPDE